MENKERYLELFTALIRHIDEESGNTEFSTDLFNRFQPNISLCKSDISIKVESLYEDIKRTRYFLSNIEKKDWLEGFKFYEKIKIPEVKIELIKDYKEMKIADRENDIVEYARRIIMQLENCINTVIIVVEAHSVIESNPQQYAQIKSGKFSFFNANGEQKKMHDIKFSTKMNFIREYYQLKEKVYYEFKDFNQMLSLRNVASHRGNLTEEQRIMLAQVKENIAEYKTRFFAIYLTIFKELKDVFHTH